jgi:hypothetical protein
MGRCGGRNNERIENGEERREKRRDNAETLRFAEKRDPLRRGKSTRAQRQERK